ncbi:MAG: hypothetical protein KatS3mg031_2157 [Chitinophagales bacterium]|nr:MAG: hypothetical protein KatS3mg031_2157 [Chitinophagales bacterium]
MAKTILTVLVILLIVQTISAQKAELLKGKWEFKDIANKEKLDTIILKQAILSFAKTQIEFMHDGKLSYNPLGNNQFSMYKGTWSLNKEQTKVSAVLTQSSSNNSHTAEWEIKGLTENELKLDMGNNAVIAFRRPPVELTGLAKTCNIELFNKLASGVANKDLDAIKSALKYYLSVTGYTEGEKETNRWGDSYIDLKSNEKFGLMKVPLTISKYDNGEFSVYRNMSQEEINFTRKELKKAEAANKGWKYKGTNGFWEYWENGDVVFWFSAKEIGSGSDTNIYTKKQIRMN